MQKSKKISRNIKALRERTAKLASCSKKKLEDAVCDIIDLGGYSVSVLLKSLYSLPKHVQEVVVRKLEDFVYFNPEHGIKFIKSVIAAAKKAPPSLKPSLIAMIADIAEHEQDEKVLYGLTEDLFEVIKSDADPARVARAVDSVSKLGVVEAIPSIIKLMAKHSKKIENASNYHFIETALSSLKRLGGEPLVRLLINPSSVDAIRQLRIEWKDKKTEVLQEVLKEVQNLNEEFAQIMLKIIDLSDFNLAFTEMIKEGLNHTDKWVRQEATLAMQKAAEAFDPEVLLNMLSDKEKGVRLMAVTSLGGFSPKQTGTILEKLALKPSESLEIRLNALYALFSQKNLGGLENVINAAESAYIILNAKGLSCLLMSHDDGLERMLDAYVHSSSDLLQDASRYLLEIAVPEDIEKLIKAHAAVNSENQREHMVSFLILFAKKNSGPALEKAISKLSPQEQKAIELLMPKTHLEAESDS